MPVLYFWLFFVVPKKFGRFISIKILLTIPRPTMPTRVPRNSRIRLSFVQDILAPTFVGFYGLFYLKLHRIFFWRLVTLRIQGPFAILCPINDVIFEILS